MLAKMHVMEKTAAEQPPDAKYGETSELRVMNP
jgi:hypothetical protein